MMCERVNFLVFLLILIMMMMMMELLNCSQNFNNNNNNITRIFKREALDGRLQDYLMNFGYLTKSADGAFALRTEKSIRDAISELQEFAGIPVTGQLDEKTVKLMKTPRCGLPDIPLSSEESSNNSTLRRKKRYTIHGMKWPYTDLTWSLRTKDINELDPYAVRYVISKALAVWSKHSKLTFAEVDSDRADILIYFYRREHGDNFPFDGKGVILAHAFFPTGTRTSVDVHFDGDESWTTSIGDDEGTVLFNVAAHEFGHSLGLSHSNVEGALMYPWYSEMKDGFNYELPQDDRLAIQFLYGSREEKQWERIPVYNPPRTSPTTTVKTTTTTTTTTTRKPNTIRHYPRYPYDPRYPNGKPTYKYDREKETYKPINPDKNKPNNYPKVKHDRHHGHKYPYTGRHYPSPAATTPYHTTTPKYHHHTHRTIHVDKEYAGDGPPNTCDTSYDAVAVIRRELFIFKDRYFWRIGDNGRITSGYPAEITRLFRGFPRNLTHVDAVYERADGNIVFFVDDKYYVFSGVSLLPTYPKSLSDLGLPKSIKKIDGAMIWGHNGKTYFFSAGEYWRYDDEVEEVEKDYPRQMKRMWKGVESHIDAVFQWKDGKTYFFKGKGFWKFNDQRMRVEHYDQKLSAPIWMGCSYDQNDVNEKLPYTHASQSSSSSSMLINYQFLIIIIIIMLKVLFKNYCDLNFL